MSAVKKYDGGTWQPISPKKLKGAPYTGTLPAVLTGTKAGYLHRYKIYGNTEQTGTPTPENPIEPSECGERTENLFNTDREEARTWTLDTNAYIIGCLGNAKTCYPAGISYYSIGINHLTVEAVGTGGYGIGVLIDVSPSTTYTFSFDCDIDVPEDRSSATYALVTEGGALGTMQVIYGNNTTVTFTTGATSRYLYVVFRVIGSRATYSNIMLVEGSTAPTSYEPYGYKLSLTSGSTPVDIFIGDDTLSTEEYVDSGTEKIYRMVGGVLTPVDPPVPFPQIPTSANSTTISWAGEGLAPSQFDSIQEWVDIPTYKYTNGEWVADT